uniref:Glycerol-3-phosphate dehydrogenase [NAD(P)+] n=1 Tax=Lygus hesperus TaxID=30085 RepID=A0A0A9YSY0_LYGHE
MLAVPTILANFVTRSRLDVNNTVAAYVFGSFLLVYSGIILIGCFLSYHRPKISGVTDTMLGLVQSRKCEDVDTDLGEVVDGVAEHKKTLSKASQDSDRAVGYTAP